MSDKEPFDLLLRGGHVICPASGLSGVIDVAIRGGRIAAIQRDILPSSAKEVVDVRGRLVLPGMIDTHAHVYKYVSGRFGLDADMVGVHSGVTTVIDQGGPSCIRGGAGKDAGLRLPLFVSRGRIGGPLLSEPLQPGVHRRRCDGEGRRRQPGSCARHQGPRRDRRLRALGHQGHSAVGGDRAQNFAAGLRPFRPALGPAAQRRQW